MSNKRASIRRARKEAERMGKLKEKSKQTNTINLEYDLYHGQEDGKLFGIYAMCHVMHKTFGWGGKRCNNLINLASDDTLRANSMDTSEIILFAWRDRVKKAMPKIDVKANLKMTEAELVQWAIYCDARNDTFQLICMFVMDTLGDMHTYNFGNVRLNRFLNGMAEEYKLMQEKPLKWFEKRCNDEVQIEIS